MIREVCFVIFFAYLNVVQGSVWKTFQNDNNINKLKHILSKSAIPIRDQKEQNEVLGGKSKDGLQFSWKSCGSKSDLAQIESLSLGPDPLVLSGNFTLAVKASLSKTISSPIKVELKIQKKVFVWIDVPCVDSFGSCTYDDVCTYAEQVDCPAVFKKYGLPCQCPVAAGNYNLPASTLPFPDIPLPGFLEDGEYKAQATATTSQGQQILCLEIEFKLKK